MTLAKSTHLWLSLACLAVLPSQVQGQEATGRFMLEAGIVGDNQCPGQYVGINGRVAGPVSLYGMVETYRCAGPYVTDLGGNTGKTGIAIPLFPQAGSRNHIGASVLLGRSSWLVRPRLRVGIRDYVEPTAGASLTFGRRYGARFILQIDESDERFQMGGYVSF